MRHSLTALFVLAAGACGGSSSSRTANAQAPVSVATPSTPEGGSAAATAPCFDTFPHAEAVRAIAGTGPGDLWAVGLPGVILHHDGAAWSASCLDQPVPLAAVWASGPADAWAAGEQSVYRWNGAAWTRVSVGSAPTGSFNSIWGTRPDDVWLLADDAVIHWDGTGFRRATLADMRALGFPFGTFHEIWGTGPADVWIAAERGTLHWDGAGWWGSLAAPEEHVLQSVWAGGSAEAWTVGVSLDGGGAAWRWDGRGWRPDAWSGGAPLFGSVRGAGGATFFQTSDGLLERRGTALRSLSPPAVPAGAPLVLAANDLWLPDAVGIAHWDGARWTRSLVVPRE